MIEIIIGSKKNLSGWGYIALPLLVLCLLFFAPYFSEAATYKYDQHHRLIGYHNGLLTLQYTYDDTGNRLSLVKALGDSDLDNIPDTIESMGCTDPMDADTDDDGILDGVEDLNQNNIVEPGETDPCNSDTDGDGLQDGTELGIQFAPNPDTANSFIPDQDPTTTTDPLNNDSDSDWIPDGTEDINKNGKVDPGESDPLDQETLDTDNDGLFDALEKQTCTSATHADTDGDTILDGDEDSNHNGIMDQGETDPCNSDTDGDGEPDNTDTTPTGSPDHMPKILQVIDYLLLLKDSE